MKSALRRDRSRQFYRCFYRPATVAAVKEDDDEGIRREEGHLQDLRHTHATILLKAGVPVKVVSERLGHANPAFTISVYQHVIPGMQADAATVFSNLIAGALEPPQPLDVAAEDDE